MNKPEILKLVREYFNGGGICDDGSCSEYYGDPDAFVKFAEKCYKEGRFDGYDKGYDDAFYEHGGY